MTAMMTVTARKGNQVAKVDGQRVHFSPNKCFAFDDGAEDRRCLAALAEILSEKPGLAVIGRGPLLGYLLKHEPMFADHLIGVIPFNGAIDPAVATLPVLDGGNLPDAVRTVFLCDTLTYPRTQMRRMLPSSVEIVEPTILADTARSVTPLRAWTPLERHIYPIDVPEVVLPAGKDLIIVDCPARNLALMPNGLAYVNNALKKSTISFAVFDLDIVTYHRFHIRRLFDDGGRVVLPSGRVLPLDPWQAEHYDLWNMGEVVDYFMPIIEEAAEQIVKAAPKILGLSLQACNESYSRRLVNLVRAKMPDIIVVVGGFSCYNADIGLKAFPEADYMCIGEADLTVGPLMEALVRGERPKNAAGVVSRYDDPNVPFIPAPMPHNLSALESPKYEWVDINIYRNYNGYQLTPIIASRGCRWSRCTFCAERFYWRIRDPKEFADELEWLSAQGCTLFMFNESDLNGMPEKVLEICDEIIARNLNVKLTGQLRIHKKSDRAFFQKLRQAGFVALRFGVDAFSENTLRLQKKGYTPEMVSQNLKDCWEAGIFTEVNWVIGVPGETDADVDEGIELILKNREYIGRLANINPLILVNGGVYWLDPEAHNIVFHEPKDELYAKYPRTIPADLWHSTEPYIDGQVRKERFERIVLALFDAGFPVGDWAQRVIEDVRYARDRNRAGGAKSSAVKPTESQQGRQSEPSQRAIKEEAAAVRADAAKPAVDQRPHASVVGEERSRLVRQTATHNILFYKGNYFALPKALGDVDLAVEDVAGRPGVVVDTDEKAVLAELELVAQWADSRGHFDAQEQQRARGSLFKANSALGEAELPELKDDRPWIVRYDGLDYAIERSAVDAAFSVGAAGASQDPSGGDLVDQELTVLGAISKDATPELLRTIGYYNLVQFDGEFYGAPQGYAIDWHNLSLDDVPGMIVARTAKEATSRIEAALGRSFSATASDQDVANRVTGPASQVFRQPILLETIGEHNIVGYEGWIYGIPRSLGAIDLMEADVTEMPGIIKDVSRDVVVDEINDLMERARAGREAAARAEAEAQLNAVSAAAGESVTDGEPEARGERDIVRFDNSARAVAEAQGNEVGASAGKSYPQTVQPEAKGERDVVDFANPRREIWSSMRSMISRNALVRFGKRQLRSRGRPSGGELS
jgi:radical SAM superfamily enzyme YgiQ (UPF0313 family)